MTTKNTDLLPILSPVAFQIGSHIRDHHVHAGIGSGQFYGLNNNYECAWSGERRITLRAESGAEVTLFDIGVEPVRPEDVTIGDVEDDGPQEIVRANTFESWNELLEAINNEMVVRDLEGSTHDTAEAFARDVGLKLAVGFEQSVGYGSEVAQIQGESKFRMDLETTLGMAWNSSASTSRVSEHETTRTREFVEPAMHKTLVDRIQTIGPAKRLVVAKGKLRFGVEIYAPGHWKENFNSRRDLLAAMRGIEIPGQSSGLVNMYRKHRFNNPESLPFFGDFWATVEHTQRFKERGKIQVRTRAEPLNDKARIESAIKLLTHQYPGNSELGNALGQLVV